MRKSLIYCYDFFKLDFVNAIPFCQWLNCNENTTRRSFGKFVKVRKKESYVYSPIGQLLSEKFLRVILFDNLKRSWQSKKIASYFGLVRNLVLTAYPIGNITSLESIKVLDRSPFIPYFQLEARHSKASPLRPSASAHLAPNCGYPESIF